MPEQQQLCHYVSRFLTRGWETPFRELHYYDFESDEFGLEPSRSLLAIPGLNSREVESRLDQLFETPFAIAREALLSQPAEAPLTFENQRVSRAMHLFVWVQGARATDALSNDEGYLERFVSCSDDELDQIAWVFGRLYRTVGLRIPGQQRLYCPGSGVFSIVVPDSVVGYSFGLAVPIHEMAALAVIRPTAVVDRLFERDPRHHVIPMYSVGPTHGAKRVVYHPVLEEHNSMEDIREQIHRFRAGATDMIKKTNELHELLRSLDRRLGLAIYGPHLDPQLYPPPEVAAALPPGSHE
jgi:hypothetical protein